MPYILSQKDKIVVTLAISSYHISFKAFVYMLTNSTTFLACAINPMTPVANIYSRNNLMMELEQVNLIHGLKH